MIYKSFRVFYFLIGLLFICRVQLSAQVQIIATGSANTFNVVYPANLSVLSPGMLVTFFSNQTITGSASLNLNGTGPVLIKKNVNQNLAPGDILGGQPVSVIYDGTIWHLLSNSANTPTSTIWSSNGSNIYPTVLNSNIGIGTSTPGANLDVNGKINMPLGTTAGIYLSNSRFLSGDASSSLSLGLLSGNSNSSGGFNTLIGYKSGNTITTGNYNVFTGAQAGMANTSGYNNVFVGNDAGLANVGGQFNTFVGSSAGKSNVSGFYNIALGYNSDIIGNVYNAIAIGQSATVGGSNTMALGGTGTNAVNVGIGIGTPQNTLDIVGGARIRNLSIAGSIFSNSLGDLYVNTAAGILGSGTPGGVAFWSANNTITANGANLYWDNSNFRLGVGTKLPAYSIDVSGDINLGLGANVYRIAGNEAMRYYVNGSGNGILLGGAGNTAITGYSNVLTGYQSGAVITSGNSNAFYGFRSGYYNSIGSRNTYIGHYAGANYGVVSGDYNTYLGAFADANVAGLTNAVAIGYAAAVGCSNCMVLGGSGMKVGIGLSNPAYALDANGDINVTALSGIYRIAGNEIARYMVNGSGNSIFLGGGGNATTSGFANVMIGDNAGSLSTSGYTNSFIGVESGVVNTTGYNNTFLGYRSGYYNSSGFRNTYIGVYAGANYGVVSGGYNTFLGAYADANVAGLTNAVAIGYAAAVGCSNCMVLGGTGMNVGIGTSVPQAELHVNGFTKLGNGAPAIQMKYLTMTTSATQGGCVSLAHGVTPANIIGIQVTIDYGTSQYINPGYTFNPGYEFNWIVNPSTNIQVCTIAGNSANILSKTARVLITYQ